MTLPGHLQDKTGATPTCLLAETSAPHSIHVTLGSCPSTHGQFLLGELKHQGLLPPLKGAQLRRAGEDTGINLFLHFTLLRPSSCVFHLAASSCSQFKKERLMRGQVLANQTLRPNTQPTFAEGQKVSESGPSLQRARRL